jgi:predicted PurR-regulated permease PerM
MTVPPADPAPNGVDSASMSTSADGAPTVEAGSRGWLRRWRRITQPTPPDFNPGTSDDTAGVSLLDRNPFQIGFFGTIGAMAAVALVTTISSLGSILLLVVFAFALALGLNPAVSWLHARGLRRGLAVLTVALVALILLGLATWALVPVIIQQVELLITQAPIFLENLRQNPQIAALDAQYKVIDKAVEFVSSGAWISGLFGGLLGAGQAVATGTFSVIITMVLTLYFLITLPSIKDVIYQLAPASRRPRVRYLANEMFKRVGGYVSGLFTVMLLWMTITVIFLNIVGIGEYAVALMVVVGLLALIPVVGTTTATIILSIVAFTFSPTTGFITLGFFLVYQQVDAYFIAPKIFARSVQIPAVLVMLAAIAGGMLVGILGAILAIPITAALLLLYREVLVPHLDRR